MDNFKKIFNLSNWYLGIWLLFLLFPLTAAWPFNSPIKFVGLCLIILFIFDYYEVYVSSRSAVWLLLEILLVVAIGILNMAPYMIMFPAWQIGFVRSKRWFGALYASHLLSYFVIVAYILFVHKTFAAEDWEMTIIYGLIACLAPLASRSIKEHQEESTQISQSNQRLTRQVKQDERERIARDLHDTLGQSFSMISIKTDFAKKILLKDPEKLDLVNQQLNEIADTSRHDLQLVRDIVADLRSETLSSVLINASENLKTAHIRLLTQNEAQTSDWPASVQHVFAACFAETVTNIIRHSKATRCLVDFERADQHYRVKIFDDGVGFNTTATRLTAHGLVGIHERLVKVGGQADIQSDKRGTNVVLTLPSQGAL